MRLKRLLIRGFGQLRGEIDLESGAGTVALLLERNEAGKSTLAAAIVAGLYGIQTDRRRARGGKVEQDLYRPWSGGPFGLALTLEAGGREIVIDRDLERGSVRVLEGTEDVTDRFQSGSRIVVGERLTGLTREQFLLSTFVGQGDIVWSDAAGLTDALQRVADSQGGRATASAAVGALDHALTHYDGITLAGSGRVDTEIDRCQKAVDEAARALEELEAQHAAFRQRIEDLQHDDQMERQNAQQREILRARRLRSEADAIEEILTQDSDLQHRVQAAEQEIEAAGNLDRLDDEILRRLEVLRRRFEVAQGEAQRAEEEADRASAERAEAVAMRDALGLSRRPTQDDVDRLWHSSMRHQDAGSELERLEAKLSDSERELATRGYRLERAQELATHFETLRDEDRVRLSNRTQEMLRLEERRESLEDQYAQERQRESAMRRDRSRLMRTGWIFTALAVMAAAAIVVFADSIPLPLGVVRGVAIALLAIGPVLVVVGSRRGAGARKESRARQAQIEEARLQLTEDEAELDARWSELAQRVGIAPEELESQYREFRTVEVAARSAASVQTRIRDLDRIQVAALEEGAALDALFAERDRSLDLPAKVELLKRALESYAHADQVTAIADSARQRLEVAKNAVRQAESKLRQGLRDAGIDISATDSIASGFERLRREADRLRQARQLRDEVLPALRQRLLEPSSRETQRRHLEALRSEGLRLQHSIAEHMRALGLDLSQLEATLADPLSQAEFDDRLQRLTEQEGRRRAAREAERTEVHAFLSRYENEAPTLRASIERHRLALRRAEEFRAAVTLARNTLEEIGRETHRTWSAALNKHCNEVLSGLRSRATRLSFAEDLTLRLEQEGQTLTGQEAAQHLSAGALDAIYLAARIAVSRFLSGGTETLPLILDDPFANADDPRLLSGVQLLMEQIAPRQQVLLMACQHSRYEWLRNELGRPPRLVTLDVSTHSTGSREDGDRGPDDSGDSHHARA